MTPEGELQPVVEIAADTHDLCGECPVWVQGEKALYWADIVGRRVYRLVESNAQPTILHRELEITGLIPHIEGGFIAVNSQGLWRWDETAHLEHLLHEVEGALCQLNDCIADRRGRVLSGSQFFDPYRPYPSGKLFLFDLDGLARILDEGFALPNGMGWSPDGRHLYLTDTIARRIYVYDYNEQNGSLNNRRTLVQISTHEGMPDGLTVDADGYIWSAQWYGGQIVRYDPSGQEERRVSLPAKQTSSLAFGGSDLTDLYVTSAGKHEDGPFPEGYESSGYLGGALYRVRTDIVGRLENPARISHPKTKIG